MTIVFHGRNAGDVYGDVEGFNYELRFSEPPTDDQFVRMARLWWDQFGTGPLRGTSWRVSGPFAYVHVHMGGTVDPKRCSTQVAQVAERLHEVLPVKEVVFLDADEDLGALDPGPAAPAGRRPVDPSLPKPGPHPAFDRTFRQLHEEAQRARFAAVLASTKPNHAGLRICEPVRPLAQADYPAHIRKLFDDQDGCVLQGEPARPLRRPPTTLRVETSVAVVIDGAVCKVPLPEGWTYYATCAPRPDGGALAVPAQHRSRANALLLVDTATAEVRELWRAAAAEGENRVGVAWLDSDVLALQMERRLVVLRVGPEGCEEVATSAGGTAWIYALREGRLLFGAKRNGIRLLSWDGRKLRVVGDVKLNMLPHAFVDGRVVLRHDDVYFELTRLDEVLEDVKPKKPAKAPRRQGKVAKGKPTWVEIDSVPSAPVVAPEIAEKARGGWSDPGDVVDARLRWGPERNPTAVAAPTGHVATVAAEGMTLLEPGADAPTQVPGGRPARIAISPAGTRAYGLSQGLHCITNAHHEQEVVAWGFQLKLGDLVDVAAVGENQVALLGDKGLVVLQKAEDGWSKVAGTRVEGGTRVLVSREGLIAVLANSATPLVAYAFDKGKLKKIASSQASVEDIRLVEGRVYAVCADGRGLLLSA